MTAVLAAQFLSAAADNALLFGALALLRHEAYPSWTQPLLQEFFVAAYILLAPFAGPFSDSRPKGTVMLLANGLSSPARWEFSRDSIHSSCTGSSESARRSIHPRSTASCPSSRRPIFWSKRTG
jgi:hypothetical protein